MIAKYVFMKKYSKLFQEFPPVKHFTYRSIMPIQIPYDNYHPHFCRCLCLISVASCISGRGSQSPLPRGRLVSNLPSSSGRKVMTTVPVISILCVHLKVSTILYLFGCKMGVRGLEIRHCQGCHCQGKISGK